MWRLGGLINRRPVLSVVGFFVAVAVVSQIGERVLARLIGDDVGSFFGAILPLVAIALLITAVVGVAWFQRQRFLDIADGAIEVRTASGKRSSSARKAESWAAVNGYRDAGGLTTSVDGREIGPPGSAHFVRDADHTVAHVAPGIVSFTTELSDGRRLMTATVVAIDLPGVTQQRVRSVRLDELQRVHTEGLAIIAAHGVTPVPGSGDPLAQQQRDEEECQEIIRRLGPRGMAQMGRRLQQEKIGTLAEGKALVGAPLPPRPPLPPPPPA